MMLRVWHDARTVGTLSQKDRRLAFKYDLPWISAPDSFPLSPRLPLAEAEFQGDEPLYFFSNLLPEGALLRALCKLKRLPEGDTFAQLVAFGADAAGAFELLPDGETPSRKHWDYKRYTARELSADLERMRKGALPLLGSHQELRLSLAGAQDKLPVHFEDGKLSLPMGGAPSTHILKPNLEPRGEFPVAVENEALCLTLAQLALSESGDILVAKAAVIENAGEKLLLVERFDRARDERGWRRLHQLDFCQLAGVLPDQKCEKDGGPGFARLFSLLGEHSALPAVDRLHALDWALFNFLIGNADAHAKNIAVMPAGGGLYLLAPFYDLLATSFYRQLTANLAMRVGGEDRPDWIRAANWQRYADDGGFNRSLLRDRIVALGERVSANLDSAAERIGLGKKSPLLPHLRKTVAKRLRISSRIE